MARLYDTYAVVRIVDKLAQKIEEESSSLIRYGTPNTRLVREKYIKPHWFSRVKKRRRVELALSMAIGDKYLVKGRDMIDGMPHSTLKVNTNGQRLLERSMLILPKGLVFAWMKKNSELNKLIFGLIGGFAIGVPSVIITLMSINHG